MPLKHEAFIDLENVVAKALKAGLVQLIAPAVSADKAAQAGSWDVAHEFIDDIEFHDFALGKAEGLKILTKTALFLGAARFAEIRDTDLFKQAQTEESVLAMLSNAAAQVTQLIKVNAEKGLKKAAHEHIERKRKGALENEIFKFDASMSVGQVAANSTGAMMDLAATTMVSRVSNLGFLLEAGNRDVGMYKVSETLDGSTCPVCKSMHNKQFPVPVGLNHLTTALSMGEPDVQRSLSPWPDQSKFNVALIGKQSTEELAANGLATPPYHPHCRGILLVPRTQPAVDLDVVGIGLGLSSGVLHDGGTIEQASALLFGEEVEEEVFV